MDRVIGFGLYQSFGTGECLCGLAAMVWVM